MSFSMLMVLMSRALAGMVVFWRFFKDCLEAVPEELGLRGPNLDVTELQDPRRLRMRAPVRDPQAVAAELRRQAECCRYGQP